MSKLKEYLCHTTKKNNSEFYNKVKKAINNKNLLVETVKETDKCILNED